MHVAHVGSTGGDVWLRADDSLLDVSTDGTPSVVGNSLDLAALNGEIGTLGNDLEINSNGVTNASATGGDVRLIETTGSLSAGSIAASGGLGTETVYLKVINGDLLNGNFAVINVTAVNFWFQASGNVGSAAHSLTTAVDNIVGRAISGSIWIDQTGAVTIGGVNDNTGAAVPNGLQAAGSITFTAHSPITINANVIAGGAILITSVDTGIDDSIVVSSPVTVQGASVTIRSGDSITLQPNTHVTATSGAVSLTADYAKADGGVASILVDHATIAAATSITLAATGDVTVTSSSGTASASSIAISAGGAVSVTLSTLTAASSVTVSAGLDIGFNGSNGTSGTATSFTAGGGFSASSSHIHAGTSAAITANGGDVSLLSTSVDAGTWVSAFAHGTIVIRGSPVTAHDFITLTAAVTDVLADTGSSLTATTGPITVNAGRNITFDQTTTATANTAITFNGDIDNTADASGTTILLQGTMVAPLITVNGNDNADTITLQPRGTSFVYGRVEIYGRGASDLITVDRMTTLDSSRKYYDGVGATPDQLDTGRGATTVRYTVNVDGGAASDQIVVNLTGTTDYILNVTDSGALGDGADVLTINGTGGDDLFLLRAGFVSRLTQTASGLSPLYERVNYDRTINVLRVNGGDGADSFYVDDNSAITTLDGGAGDDLFQFGQMFGAARDIPNVAPGDQITTVETTLGFLTRGISFATTAYGGDGEDTFTVYSNKAVLKLFGEDGNDEFVVRAFLIKNTSELATADTTVSGGTGADHIEYNVNAPVSIDGGEGVDSVVVIGTEADDSFVITKDGVRGAGLNVTYTNVEKLEVDGMEGNDHFYVLSTDPHLVTTLIGGLGSDTFDVGGDVVTPVVALSVEGTSGYINHSVSSADPDYNGIFAEGIQLNVANGNAGQVIVTQTGGNTAVHEGSGDSDTYTVQLAAGTFVAGATAYLTVSAALSSQSDGADARSVEFQVDGTGPWFNSTVLTFTGSGWYTAHTITVRAIDDSALEGTKTAIISSSVEVVDNTTGAHLALDRAPIANVEVTVYDDDKPGIVLTQTGTGTQVVEGGATDTYVISLTRAPDSGETVYVTLGYDATQITLSAANPAQASRLSGNVVSFSSTDWTPFTVKAAAVDDATTENQVFVTVSHTISTSGGSYALVAGKVSELDVDVRDNDAGNVIVTQSGGSTLVDATHTDSYTLRLSKAPTAPVTIQILTDGKTLVSSADTRFTAGSGSSAPYVTFDATNWNNPITIVVSVNPAASIGGGGQPVQAFPASPHITNPIAGPLVIEGGVIKDRTVKPGVKLPTERDVPLPIVASVTNEANMTDTLNVFDDASVLAETGTLAQVAAGSDELSALTEIYGNPVGGLTAASFGQITGLSMNGTPLSLDFGPGHGVHGFQRGIVYHGVEVVDVLLGRANDTFTVNSTVDDSITVIQGGGGDDHLFANVGTDGTSSAPLILLGDTTADGSFYDATTAAPTGHGRQFDTFGNDTIDASGSTRSVTIYGGPGNDTILGSQAGDHIAGGSGDDTIDGQAGADHIYGDDGFNLDLSKRISLSTQILSVTTAYAATGAYDRDRLQTPGNDTIQGGDGNDIVLGDYGVIAQTAGTNRIFTTGNVMSVATVRPGEGGADTLNGGNGADTMLGGFGSDTIDGQADNDVLIGDDGLVDWGTDGNLATFDTVRTSDDALGSADTIHGSGGNDWILGGFAGDTISGDDGNDIVIGDNGSIVLTGGVVTAISALDTANANGGNDQITGGAGDDVILGGVGSDTVQGNDGNDIVVGDDGQVTYSAAGVIQQIASTDWLLGAGDAINGNDGSDLIIGGFGGDSISGGAGDDVVLGDQGTLSFTGGALTTIDSGDTVAATGAADSIWGGTGNDLLIGGVGGDWIDAGDGNDVVLGDMGTITLSGGVAISITTKQDTFGGADTIYGGSGEDILAGGAYGDNVDGGTGRDEIFGDNVSLLRDATIGSTDPRFRAGGATLYDANLQPIVGNAWLVNPDGAAWWTTYRITLNDMVSTGSGAAPANSYGNDYLAGGAGDDRIFGQLGNDVIQGDGSIDAITGTYRVGDIGPDGRYVGSFDNLYPGTGDRQLYDGNDYIEGNAGSDVIFGNQGQDDLIGGSSDLFSLTTPDKRSDGVDVIFGGSGIAIGLNDPGDATANGHANDADVIVGDNGDIFRPLAGGQYEHFTYDNYGTSKVNAASVKLLDYSPTGDAYYIQNNASNQALNTKVAGSNTNIGGADILHGEGGDDVVYGETGNDTIFGDGQNDELYGNSGGDWISGGTGDDAILGDDGLIEAQRNGSAETLYGLASQAQGGVSAPGAGGGLDWVTYPTGVLLYTTILSPYAVGGNDIIYGGLGNDALHGGAGDDAISGAEALPNYYDNGRNPLAYLQTLIAAGYYTQDDVLGYNPTTTLFRYYNANAPFAKPMLPNGADFLLNFTSSVGSSVLDDGMDSIFGDVGNDWIVGGTNRDLLFGGFGDDYLQADDNLDTPGSTTNDSRNDSFFADIAYGGAGRDVLIANSAQDRLVDWAGEFNSYWVAFHPYGEPTVFRAISPAVKDFVFILATVAGEDPTRGANRWDNELGEVAQGDPQWGDQTGGPRDPQNIHGGGKRDSTTVLAAYTGVTAVPALSPIVLRVTVALVLHMPVTSFLRLSAGVTPPITFVP
jgi:Ca2+-binding RTX toxin-like protein